MMHNMHDLQCLNAGITPGCYKPERGTINTAREPERVHAGAAASTALHARYNDVFFSTLIKR